MQAVAAGATDLPPAAAPQAATGKQRAQRQLPRATQPASAMMPSPWRSSRAVPVAIPLGLVCTVLLVNAARRQNSMPISPDRDATRAPTGVVGARHRHLGR